MSNLEEIEKAVKKLTQEEFAQFREWFENLDASLWDEQFENDVKKGKLDKLAEESLKDYREGNYYKL